MKIKILGTRAEVDEKCRFHSKHSGVLIDDQLLLDLGEREFLKYQPKWILITHLHPDHAYFVRRGQEDILTTKAKVYSPESKENLIATILDRMRKLGSYTVAPLPTLHSKHVKSQAYFIKKNGQSILYTGDLVWIEKKYLDKLGKIDLVITEASFLRRGGMVRRDKETGQLYGHNGIPNLIHLFKPYTRRILFIHFGSWFYENIRQARKNIARLAKENGVEGLIGFDGMEIDLN